MVEIKEIRHDWLELPDGTRLAFRAWMPADALTNPVPAILEYLPYRKSDGTIVRDEITMAETATHGYACIRVDIRGCGESEGLFDDEYSKQEHQDGVDVIEWISNQAWCDGNVGMVGISWGGFNSLQIAALNPPALKAIITQCSTDDRYRDDIHYSGGCLLNDNMDWAAFFWAYALGRAPDPSLVGSNWKSIWKDRLTNMPFLATPWIQNQTRNDYWKHGSVCENYSDIKIPVYAIGGWADAYKNTVFTLLQNLSVPKKGLVGPWAHKYPNIAYPNPKMDYVAESVRWWDKWLKNIDNGIDEEPELNYFLQNGAKPKTDYDAREGCWVAESSWPTLKTDTKTWYLASQRLTEKTEDSYPVDICSPQQVGLDGGRYCVGIRLDMEHPDDQRIDDSGSLIFDTAPLLDAMPIAGQIEAKLALSSSTPHANVIVRVSDVHPTGEVTKITHGILNLTHRDSHEFPELLEPGKIYNVNIALNHIAYVVPKGHKVRVSVSTAYWPLIWPCKDNTTLTVVCAKSSVTVPFNSAPSLSDFVPSYDKATRFDGEVVRAPNSQRTVYKDYKSGIWTLETVDDFGCNYYSSSNSEIDFNIKQVFSIHSNDPLSAKNEIKLHVDMGRDNWRTSISAVYTMTCDADQFYIRAKWEARTEGEIFFEKVFDETILRNFV
ncbi:CocE/NonD family hydrolase [Vibrio ziniensis]|uniref:CocE/NonD family hydrolase n=1 Tax=Vibrio ziniensis TaxID=2711221 RepID=A0A6G7CP13_9VIBR|nr:CocE/NonD family hydrolase [Vibrio ziniensis]QIH43877.1 CocE/NonD family hydrolase [Vibrio ziniensis]